MRILVLFAHPLETSFVAALHARIVETLRLRGHEVDDLDLYAELRSGAVAPNPHRLSGHEGQSGASWSLCRTAARRGCPHRGVPIWHDGFPAILKGYFDCVFLPGVSFEIDRHGVFLPTLPNIKRLAAVCGYGADRKRRPASAIRCAASSRAVWPRTPGGAPRIYRPLRHGCGDPVAPEAISQSGDAHLQFMVGR